MKQTLVTKILNYILVLLGFATTTSCAPNSIIPDIRSEYGTPTMDYVVSGKVVNHSNKPIPNIKVSTHSNKQPGLVTVYTDAAGSFSVSSQSAGPMLKFEDVDGPENGGEFADKIEQIKVKQVGEGDGHWYWGKFEAKDVTIMMEEKK